MEDIWDEEDSSKRAKLLERVNADPNTAELRKIYKNVLNEIKSFCPDLNEELGFKPWSETLTKRVQNWINIVLSGNDPASSSAVPEAAKGETSTATVEEANDTPVSVADNDDDLPF